MWSGEHTVDTEAPAAAIWTRWTRVDLWSADDPTVASARLDGPLAVGVGGTIKQRRGPAVRFTVAALEPQRRFTTMSSLPFAKMAFEHTLEPTPVGVRFTHRVRLTGPLASVFGRLLGRRLVAELPQVMDNVAAHSLAAPALAEAPTAP